MNAFACASHSLVHRRKTQDRCCSQSRQIARQDARFCRLTNLSMGPCRKVHPDIEGKEEGSRPNAVLYRPWRSFQPTYRTYLPFLFSKQRAPRCSFAAWRFPQVSICTESPFFHRGGFSSEIARFRISHLCVDLVLVIGDCALQLCATGKHVFRSGILPCLMAFNGG